MEQVKAFFVEILRIFREGQPGDFSQRNCLLVFGAGLVAGALAAKGKFLR